MMKDMKRYTISLLLAALTAVTPALWAQEKADSSATVSSRGLRLDGRVLDAKMLGDVRNQLTGAMPGLDVNELAGGLWNSSDYESFIVNSDQISLKYRGNGSLTFILDGFVVPFNAYSLDPSQIESITLLGDLVDKAKFGPMASNGAISIKTKTGGYNQPMRIKVNAESGIAMTGIVPEWADGVDYALLNNQARVNAGYTQLYSPLAINGFLRGDAYDLKYPNVDYRSIILGKAMPVGNASVSITGGSDRVKYATSISELYSGDIVKTDQAQDFNKINISTNVTSRINRFLTVNAGFNSSLSFRRAGRVSWNAWQNVPAVAYPVILGVNDSDEVGDDLAGLTIYGTTATWGDNYYALLNEGGFSTRRCRSGMIFASAVFDMDEWVKGLRSETYIGYSTFMSTTTSKSNNYLSYYWDPSSPDGMGVISPSHQGEKASGKSISSTGANQLLQFSESIKWDWARNGHDLKLDGSFLMFDAAMQGVGYYRRMMQCIADAKYSYRNRYVLEGVLQYAGSTRFERKNRFRPFASAGAAWIASNEDFLKDVSWIDFLKIRGQFGAIGKYSSAFGTEYLYQSDYARANGYAYGPTLTLDTWFGNKSWTSQKTTVTQLANKDLTWEYNTTWLLGVDFDFCKDFSFMFTAYGDTSHGVIEEVSSAVPSIYGIGATNVYANFTSTTVTGYEATLAYNHSFGDLKVNAGVSAYGWNGVYNILVSDDYIYDYQKKTGTSSSAIWGLECIGKYETAEQVATIPSYSSVQVGDLMYKDQNNDGKIDTNDRIILGSSQPKVRCSVNLGLRYRNFEVQAVGTGNFGKDVACTGSYFWNGWGDGNYSAFVRDNIGGEYPRLSYVKSTNNFVSSSFWLREGSWFKIQDVAITYDVPVKGSKAVKGLTLSLKGQNLATFTGFKYLDPEATSSGVSAYPLFRTVTAGAKINF